MTGGSHRRGRIPVQLPCVFLLSVGYVSIILWKLGLPQGIREDGAAYSLPGGHGGPRLLPGDVHDDLLQVAEERPSEAPVEVDGEAPRLVTVVEAQLDVVRVDLVGVHQTSVLQSLQRVSISLPMTLRWKVAVCGQLRRAKLSRFFHSTSRSSCASSATVAWAAIFSSRSASFFLKSARSIRF